MEKMKDLDKFTTKTFSTLDNSTTYEKVLNSLESNNYQSIFVTDQKNHLVGFLSTEVVLKNPKTNVSLKKITTKLPLLREFNLDKIIECYLENNLLLIPIVDQKEIITSVFDVFKVANDYLLDLEFKSEDLIDPIPFKIQPQDKIDHVMGEIKKIFVNQILVEAENKIIGFIDSQKLTNILIKPEGTSRGEKTGEKQKFEGTVENLIRENNDIVINYQSSYNANDLVNLMQKSHSSTLYVKNDAGNAMGIVKLKKLITLAQNAQKFNSNSYNISVLSAPDKNIEEICRKKIASLIERHAKFFHDSKESEGTVKFHKIENQSQKGMFKYETDIRISFGRGKDSVFTVKSDDWGSEKSLNKAYNKISRLISDKRNISKEIYHKKGIIEQEP